MNKAIQYVRVKDDCGNYTVRVEDVTNVVNVAYFDKNGNQNAKSEAITYGKKVAKFFRVKFIDAT